MSNKIALVTGANKGIGLETVRQLASQGFHVLLGARSADKGQAAIAALASEGITAEFLPIDVSSTDSIAAAVKTVESKFGHLDVLINNAGVNFDPPETPIQETPAQIYRDTFDTNFFGLIETTQAFLPLIKKSPAGRIVNVSSILGSLSFHATPGSPIYDFKGAPAYNVSKSAVNAYTLHLAYDLKDTPIKVNTIHPGWVKTEMGGEEAPMEIVDGAKTSVLLATLPEDGATGTYTHLGESLPW
jgi:NAD(P)-dependent dehydrogenase (short-subunit alcohol dehydrogenase family)